MNGDEEEIRMYEEMRGKTSNRNKNIANMCTSIFWYWSVFCNNKDALYWLLQSNLFSKILQGLFSSEINLLEQNLVHKLQEESMPFINSYK